MREQNNWGGSKFQLGLNKLWHTNVMDYCCTMNNDRFEEFRETREDLYELMPSAKFELKDHRYQL